MSPRTTPPDRSPAETTTYLEIPPAPDDRDPSGASRGASGEGRVGGAEAEPTEAAITEAAITDPDTTDADRPGPGPATAVLEPLDLPPAPATIPALPLAPRDPADRPFAAPQRSAPGKPESWWRRLLRRSR